ncbi:MAG: flavin reductase family protein [Firmicutes bacterium]|nr:flavin reductase family protein [Bacillota bacterium]
MAKQIWKPGTMLYPLPVVMVSCGDIDAESNILTIAWCGTINSEPSKTYISVRPSRYSYDMIKSTGEFVINLTTEKLARATDFCGVRSGKDIDKFAHLGLTKYRCENVKAPAIEESPVNIECKVDKIVPLGSHDMFIADVVSVLADEQYMLENGKFDFHASKPICYSHGEYYGLGDYIGKFGYSVEKKKK